MPLSRIPPITRISTFSCRLYATEGRGRGVTSSDPRVEVIRRALYPPTDRKISPSPVGVHRSDVETLLAAAIPSIEAHETITRAWNIYQRDLRLAHEEALQKKFESMKRAMDELEKLHKPLFLKATEKPNLRKYSPEEREAMAGTKGGERRAKEARVEGLFPRELRVPTDTPRRSGWDHDWKAK